MFRSIFVIINVLFWTGFLGIIAIIVSIFDKSGKMIAMIVRFWSNIILKSGGISYKVSGLEYLDPDSHYFFAGNHESAFDIPLAFAGIPYQLVSLAKKELKKIPVLGWVMIAAKHIFVDRQNHTRAVKSLEDAKESLKHYPRSVLIFPEGTRSVDGKIKRFKKGGLAMAIELGMPVVPIALCGTRDIAVKRSLKMQPGKLELRLDKPINVEDWNNKSKLEFANYVHERVVNLKQEWLKNKETGR